MIRMKKYSYFFFAILICSCTATKKTAVSTDESKTSTDLEQKAKVTVNVDSTVTDKSKTKTAFQNEKKIEETKTDNTVTKTKTTDFDTSKPIDPKSGAPPIRTITETSTENKINTQTTEAEKAELIYEIENNIRQEYEKKYSGMFTGFMTVIEQLNRKNTTKEIPNKPYKYFLLGLIIPILIYLIIFVRKKIKLLGYI